MNREEYQKAIDFIHAYLHPIGKSEWEMKKLKYRDMAIKALERERDEFISRSVIEDMGEELRTIQKSITDKNALIGFNMAVAICNKHISGKENKS